MPREVFLAFDVFFFADVATGFRGVPAASAVSFRFLVAIPDHDFLNSRFHNGTAFVSLAGVAAGTGSSTAAAFGSPLGVSVMFTPSILRTSRLGGGVIQTITTGLKSHSAAHALPRSPSRIEQTGNRRSTDEIVKLAREHVEAFNTGNWEQMRAMLASDARYDELGTQRKVEGAGRIVELFEGWKTAFPDATGTVTGAVANGNKAALEVTWKGTHTGPLVTPAGTIPASGKRQQVPAAFFLTFEGDKIKESHHYFDSMTLLTQVGAQPK